MAQGPRHREPCGDQAFAKNVRRALSVPQGQSGREMVSNAERAQTSRERAGEMRTMARDVTSEEGRRNLLSIADSYDKLAQIIESIPSVLH